MLKKSVPGFFNHDLAEVNSSKSYKLLAFSVSQFGNPSMDCSSSLFSTACYLPSAGAAVTTTSFTPSVSLRWTLTPSLREVGRFLPI